MPNKQSDKPGSRGDSGATSRTPSVRERHATREIKTDRKDSGHASEIKRKNDQAGSGAEGGKDKTGGGGGGILESILNKVTGLTVARNTDVKKDQPSGKQNQSTKKLPTQKKIPDQAGDKKPESSIPKDKAAKSPIQSARDQSTSRHASKRRKNADVQPVEDSKASTQTEPGQSDAKRVRTGRGERDRVGSNPSHTRGTPAASRIEARTKRGTPAGSQKTEHPPEKRYESVGVGSDRAGDTTSVKSEKTVRVDPDEKDGAKEEQRKYARDRLHDITNKIVGDVQSEKSQNGSERTKGDSTKQPSIPPPKDGRTRKEPQRTPRSRKNVTTQTQRDASAQTSTLPGRWDDQHSCTGTNKTTTIPAATSFPLSRPSSSSSPASPSEIAETACANPICRDWLAFNTRTLKLVDLSLLPPELCLFCGQPWPRNKSLTEAMIEVVRKRLENSPYKDIGLYCGRCATDPERRGENVDEGVQVDEAELSPDEIEPEAETEAGQGKNVDAGVQVDERDLKANDPNWSGDHYCKPLDFERDKDNLEAKRFPQDLRMRGTKRALLIGINYSGQRNELRGCRNDVVNVYRYLRANGYRDENILILLDVRRFKPPTKENIVKYTHLLVDNAKAGDSLFLHYSGHGGQTKDKEGDEADGEDECIYPVDYKRIPEGKGKLVDDELHKIVVKLPKGAQLTALFDSCHSGSILDLPWVLTKDGTMKEGNLRNPHTVEEVKRLKNCGTIILWSGCKDTQTSADTKIAGTSVGAMSSAFIQANTELLKKKTEEAKTQTQTTSLINPFSKAKKKGVPDYTYDELLARIREISSQRAQTPQLSSTVDLKPYERMVYV